MSTDLVDRLRAYADTARIPLADSGMIIEASDEIVRLRRTIARLELENELDVETAYDEGYHDALEEVDRIDVG